MTDGQTDGDQQYPVDGALTSIALTAQTATHQWFLFITAPAGWTTTLQRSGLENIMTFSKISKYRKYRKYHDIFLYFRYF